MQCKNHDNSAIYALATLQFLSETYPIKMTLWQKVDQSIAMKTFT